MTGHFRTQRLWLDLFCKAGGNARGMMSKGITPLGIDIEDQPNYPGHFLKMDALGAVKALLSGQSLEFRYMNKPDTHGLLSVVMSDIEGAWASPPCLDGTSLRHAPNTKQHKQLVPPTRKLLKMVAAEALEWRGELFPWIIENVDSDKMRKLMPNAVTLCGSHFDLGVWSHADKYKPVWFQLRRHRLFETNFEVREPEHKHTQPVIGIYGGHARNRSSKHGGRGTVDFAGQDRPTLAARALGLEGHGLTTDELSNAIPPAYAAYLIGEYDRALRLRRYLS